VAGSDAGIAYAPAEFAPGSPVANGLDLRSAAQSSFTYGNGPRGVGDNAIAIPSDAHRLRVVGGTSALPYAFTNAFSWAIFGWVYWTGSVSGTIVNVWDLNSSASVGVILDISGANLRAAAGGTSYFNVTAPLPSSAAWHFVCAWRDAADGKVRLQVDNGTVYETASASSGAVTFAGVISFGANTAGGGAIGGRLSRWGVMRGSFPNADERTYLYNSGSGRNFDEL
jgi:hypothetical protein